MWSPPAATTIFNDEVGSSGSPHGASIWEVGKFGALYRMALSVWLYLFDFVYW
jgi:hypothetical protein